MGAAALAAVVMAVGPVAWSHLGDRVAAADEGMTASPAAWSPGVGSDGVVLGAEVTFEHDRVLTRGRILADTAGPDPYVSFTPRDGTDDDLGYPLPLHVDAGVTVDFSVAVLPACGVEATAAPVFEVDSRPGSRLPTFIRALLSDPHTDTVAAIDLASWQRAVKAWCDSGVHALLVERSTNGAAVPVLVS